MTVWLAIDDADADNAAMQFSPGSHLLGPLDHEDLGLDGTQVLARQVAHPELFPERAGDPDGFWKNGRRPDGEHPDLMAAFWGDFDGQPIDAA